MQRKRNRLEKQQEERKRREGGSPVQSTNQGEDPVWRATNDERGPREGLIISAQKLIGSEPMIR